MNRDIHVLGIVTSLGYVHEELVVPDHHWQVENLLLDRMKDQRAHLLGQQCSNARYLEDLLRYGLLLFEDFLRNVLLLLG